MMITFKRNEKTNNILFIAMYVFFSAVLLLLTKIIALVFIFLIFLHLSATIYGFLSKNSWKSYLFGFLVLPTIEIIDNTFLTDSAFSFSGIIDILPRLVLYSFLWGVAGYFAALRGTDKLRSAIYILSAGVFILIQIVLTFRTF